MLSNKDISSLSWFFTEGVAAFERSTFGPMLERAELFWRPFEVANDVTARPTAETRHHGGVEPEHKLLMRYGEVSRRLQRCTQAARDVLGAFHGDLGAKWAHHERGRNVSLYHLTAAGKRLIEMARNQANAALLELSDQERLQNEINLDMLKAGKNDIRKSLIARAEREAREMYKAACAEYVATARSA